MKVGTRIGLPDAPGFEGSCFARQLPKRSDRSQLFRLCWLQVEVIDRKEVSRSRKKGRSREHILYRSI